MRTNKWIWITGALLLTCISLTGCGSSDVLHLEDYIKVSFSGVNGKGSAHLTFDSSEMDDVINEKGVAKYGGEMAFLKEYYEKVGSSAHDADTTPKLIADQNEYLKNGDVIHIACKYDEDNTIDGLLNLVDERYVYEEMEVTVDGLQEAKKLTSDEVFQNVSVDIRGIAPALTVDVQNKSDDPCLKSLAYEAHYANNDGVSGLRTGDTFIVTTEISDNTAESMQNNGYIISEKDFEKTYTVGEEDEYVSQYSQIPEDIQEILLNAAKDKMEAVMADSYNACNFAGWNILFVEDLKAGDIQMESAVVCNKKNPMDTSNYFGTVYYNKLKFYGKCRLTDSEHKGGQDVYLAVTFGNIVRNTDGKMEYDITDINTNGYANRDEMIRDEETAKKDEYSFEESTLS